MLSTQAEEHCIGLFWFFTDADRQVEMLIFLEPPSELSGSGFKTSKHAHPVVWQNYRKETPALADYAYPDWPRGRVNLGLE